MAMTLRVPSARVCAVVSRRAIMSINLSPYRIIRGRNWRQRGGVRGIKQYHASLPEISLAAIWHNVIITIGVTPPLSVALLMCAVA